MYNDCRPAEIGQQIDRQAPPQSPARGPCASAARALALIRQYPGATRLLHQADWMLGQLLGGFRYSDHNNALKLGFDPVSRSWPDWLPSAGIPVSLLPEPLPPGTPLGRISPAAARACKLPASLQLVAGTTDSTAAIIATGAAAPGDGITALGTTLVVKIISDRPVNAPEYGVYSQPFGERWLVGGSSNSGGGVLAQYFTPGQLRRLSQTIDPRQPSGLDYYPLPRPGERFPINDPEQQPILTPRPTQDQQFLHGLLEGIARIEQLAYQRLQQLGAPPLGSVRTTGGGSANPSWRKIRQRLLAVPMVESGCNVPGSQVPPYQKRFA
jgi:sugar (pentulose or hexulose) kinase